MRLPPLPTVKEIIRLYKLRALKQHSQNFLLNPAVIKRIVRAPGPIRSCHVCEVGPGPGGITRAILQSGVERLLVVEKDHRFLPGLQLLSEASGGRVQIHHGDVLNFDLKGLFPDSLIKPWNEQPPDIHIIGNLPFNVSTPLIIRWLQQMSEGTGAWHYGRVKLTLTFQKEVAERMVAPILDEQRSRLSIMCQYLAKTELKFVIPGRVFHPPPEVDVGVVTMTPLVEPQINLPFNLVEKVVRHVFHFRQKMCKRGIQTLFPSDQPELTQRMFQLSDVPPESRPFMLTIEEFNRLCHAYDTLCKERPYLLDYDYRSKENAFMWPREKLPLGI